MATNEFEVPNEWGLSDQQEIIIGSLMDDAGKFIPAYELCNGLYPDDKKGYEAGCPAPAKLRVLVQRCRDIVHDLTNGKASIETKRGKGWRVTKKSRIILAKAVDD